MSNQFIPIERDQPFVIPVQEWNGWNKITWRVLSWLSLTAWIGDFFQF